MKRKTIYIIIFCILLAGILAFLYYKYLPSEKEYVDVSISAEYNGEKIETGFVITPSGIVGNTSDTYETFSMEKKGIVITNVNIEDQIFYQNEISMNLTKNTRIDLMLTKPEKVESTIQQDRENNLINLTIYSKNFIDLDFCLRGSFSYFFIEAEPRTMRFLNLSNEKDLIEVREDKYNYLDYPKYKIKNFYSREVPYEEITKNGFEDWDVCYDGEFSLKGSYKEIEISYLEYGKITKDDFIELILIDKEGNIEIVKIK